MESGRFSSRGQLVVPKSIRDALNIKPGTEVEFERAAQGFVVRIADALSHKERLDRLVGCLKRPGRRRALSIEEMDRLVLEKARAEDERTKPRKGRRRR